MDASLLVSALILAQAATDAASAPQNEVARLSANDLEEGRALFQRHCASCHGMDGAGGRGPSLARPRLRRVSDDKALFDAIRDGIPGTEMPAVWMLSDAETWRVAGYVRSLGRVEAEIAPGDVTRGRALYEGTAGCAACHIAVGRGTAVGPELTDVGARRGAAQLRESLTDPEAVLPDRFLLVRLRTRDGREWHGERVNEDVFTIQVRADDGQFRSFRKDELADIERQKGRSSMPSYRHLLSPDELDDLVAYLSSLRGQP